MKDIEIFTGPGCSHCEQAKALLKTHEPDYTERDVSDTAVMSEFRQRLPRAGHYRRYLPKAFTSAAWKICS